MSNELYHYGVLGMKWGVRRYLDKDGNLTSEGKRRYIDDGIQDTQRRVDKKVYKLNRKKTKSDIRIARLERKKNKQEVRISKLQQKKSKVDIGIAKVEHMRNKKVVKADKKYTEVADKAYNKIAKKKYKEALKERISNDE